MSERVDDELAVRIQVRGSDASMAASGMA